MKDGYKYKKSRTKKVKRTIPLWASVAAHKNVPVTNFAGTQHRMDNILIEALRVCTALFQLTPPPGILKAAFVSSPSPAGFQ